MLQNYFKIALRNLLKHKVFSIINIAGLALGIACCLTLSLYIADEFRYDKHHEHINNIYRVVITFSGDRGLGLDKLGTASPPLNALIICCLGYMVFLYKWPKEDLKKLEFEK